MNSSKTKRFILEALKEDCCHKDITTNMLVSKNKTSEAYIFVKESCTLCGIEIAKRVFKALDPKMKFQSLFKDGTRIKKGTKIALLKGNTRALLTGERTALNFLGYLSGIATNTSKFVDKIKGLKAHILDTRKTTPGLRRLEKYAVRCGGGVNHRHNLKEMIIIKDNHREISEHFDELSAALKKFRKKNKKITVVIEVDTIPQFKQVLEAKPDIILLDNMTNAQLRKAVAIVRAMKKNRPLLEASGGVNLQSVRSIAKTGVDRISTGALTHTYKTIDISMEI